MTTKRNAKVQKSYGVKETYEEAKEKWGKYDYVVELSNEMKETKTAEGKKVVRKSATYETKGHIAIITLTRPEAMNAINLQQMNDVNWCWHDFIDDDNLLVAILTGSGNAFCSGGDLKQMFTPYAEKVMQEGRRNREKARAEGREPTHEEDPVAQHHWREIEVWKPIICAVNGWCMAAGLTMATDCDIVIAADTAMFGTPQGTRGIISATCSQRLPREIPKSIAFKMLLTGEPIDAKEAYRVGLVSDLVPLKDLMPTAMKMAEQICTLSPASVKTMKEAAYRVLWYDYDETWDIVKDVQRRILHSTREGRDNRHIGLMAFREKKEPQWVMGKDAP